MSINFWVSEKQEPMIILKWDKLEKNIASIRKVILKSLSDQLLSISDFIKATKIKIIKCVQK